MQRSDTDLPEGSEPAFEVFGHYKLMAVIRSGGMAELFLALMESFEGFTKVVAVKRVLPHLASSANFVEMFLDEARLAARMDHPHIVRVYDFGESKGHYFISMEYLPGEDLGQVFHRARLTGKRIPTDMLVSIMQSAAEGLAFAHDLTDADGMPLGVVHRDVNPSNIMVTYQGAVKVLDFGIAKVVSKLHQTEVGETKGKVAYLAPEQLTGAVIDKRTDVFGLGITLWEGLTGRRLFARDNGSAAAQAVLHEEIPTPNSMGARIPLDLERVLMKALEKDPEARHLSAAAFAEALDGYFSGRTGRPSPKLVGNYLISLFGEARADLKKNVAQGRNLSAGIEGVMRPLTRSSQFFNLPVKPRVAGGPREGPTPLPGSTASPALPASLVPALSRGGHRAVRLGAFFVLAAGMLLGASGLARGVGLAPAPAAADPLGWLEVNSRPPAAAVFVNGEPTFQLTPVTFEALPLDVALRVSVEAEGFETAFGDVTVRAGAAERRDLVLSLLPVPVHAAPMHRTSSRRGERR